MFIPQAQPHAQSLFLFPIVFGINSTFLCICRFGDWNFSYSATLATKTFRLLPPWRVLLKRFFEPCQSTHEHVRTESFYSANRKLIFSFIFGSASSDGKATGDVQEDFGGNPVAPESQMTRLPWWERTSFFYRGLLCKAVRGGTDHQLTRQQQNCFTRGREESEGWMGRGQRRRKTTFTLMTRDVVFLLFRPSPLPPLLSTNKVHFFQTFSRHRAS